MKRGDGAPGWIRTRDPLLRRYFGPDRCASCLGSFEQMYSYRLGRIPKVDRIIALEVAQ